MLKFDPFSPPPLPGGYIVQKLIPKYVTARDETLQNSESEYRSNTNVFFNLPPPLCPTIYDDCTEDKISQGVVYKDKFNLFCY